MFFFFTLHRPLMGLSCVSIQFYLCVFFFSLTDLFLLCKLHLLYFLVLGRSHMLHCVDLGTVVTPVGWSGYVDRSPLISPHQRVFVLSPVGKLSQFSSLAGSRCWKSSRETLTARHADVCTRVLGGSARGVSGLVSSLWVYSSNGFFLTVFFSLFMTPVFLGGEECLSLFYYYCYYFWLFLSSDVDNCSYI